MSHWEQIKEAHLKLSVSCRDGKDVGPAWRAFKNVVIGAADNPPYHFQLMMKFLDELGSRKSKSDIRILDHGCGSALWLLYLLANGYEGIYGVDVGGHCESLNRLVCDHLGLEGDRFFIYDGAELPFDDGHFEFVFSTQVIEHIAPDVFANYYTEECRVLVPGGMAYHQVPHRLVPYDSHTRTWFIHCLPRPVWLGILKIMGRDTEFARNQLFLRWPWIHRRQARHYLGTCDDRTMERFMEMSDLSYYDGPRGLRRIVARALSLPVVGRLGRKLIAYLVMLDTISRTPAPERHSANSLHG